MKSLIAVVALSALGLGAGAQAETVFKWVDANGVTTYSTTPPPTGMRKVSAINAAPAVSGQTPPAGLTSAEEAAYWKRQRDAAEDLRTSRQNRDTEDLKQQLLRQQIASIYDEEQRRKAEEQRRQDAYNRCVFERRTDCDSNGNPVTSYATPVVVRGHSSQGITAAAPFPVAGSPLVTNPTPGAPSLTTVRNATPGAFMVGSGSSPAPSRPTTEPARLTR